VRNRNGHPLNVYVTGQWAFVPTTRAADNQTVLYVKVPSCIFYAPCHACGAKVGERCRGKTKEWVTVHAGRKKAAIAIRASYPKTKIKDCGPLEIE
jgi:hypothetical protein